MMHFEVSTDYLHPITLGKHEHVSVNISDYPGFDPDIHFPDVQVVVYDDCVYVRTPEDVRTHRDGKKVWVRSS